MKMKPSTEYALLGALMSGHMHGYEILRFINAELESTWHISSSQLYVLLKKLEKEDLLASSVEFQENRPSKRIFSLTPDGREVFLEWLNSPTENVRDMRIEFLAKLYFFNSLGLKGGDRLIAVQTELLKERNGMVNQKFKSELDPFKKLVFRFKSLTIEAWLKWLTEEADMFFKK